MTVGGREEGGREGGGGGGREGGGEAGREGARGKGGEGGWKEGKEGERGRGERGREGGRKPGFLPGIRISDWSFKGIYSAEQGCMYIAQEMLLWVGTVIKLWHYSPGPSGQ